MQTVWPVTLFPEASRSGWAALTHPCTPHYEGADPSGAIRPGLAARDGRGHTVSWNVGHVTLSWPLADGDVDLGKRHGALEAGRVWPF